MEELTPVISSSSSSSFSSGWIYDVFLSFRGEDTRYGFTGNLYRALSDKGIHTFIDNKLESGEEIIHALFKAIEESRIAIIIFSTNYASSTFCLEELVKILDCIDQNHGLVWPIFYKVDPSDVRHLRGSYGEAIARHETKFKNDSKLQRWKRALHKAANLSGWHFGEGYKYEYEFVKKIVEEVSKRINRTPLYVTSYPVGLKPREECVISLLDLGSNKEVIMVGIHGIGGIGKTTIACAVYNAIVDQFEGECFLSNVRETSTQYGLVELQKILLSKLIGVKEIKMGSFREGISIIKCRLCRKKVLLILDDVNSLKQLQALAGGADWFGVGSRIIITTRDKHLLDVHGVTRNYDVKKLCFEEALELLSWNAFKKNAFDSRYTSILSRVTNYCNGLPLALEIIGSNLFNKTQEEWKSALDAYDKIPDKDIQNVLKVSYNDLGEIEKEIFLDIACFFNGYGLDVVKNILLSGRDYDPQYGIGVLVMKSLIKIDQTQHVKIHDLMAKMGKEIVRSQSRSNPENWSRLWSYIDILCVLKEDKGTDKIEALVLKAPQDKEVWWDGNAFKKMTNLKILIIRGAHFSCGPKYLPNSLRVLEWKNYASSDLPSQYDPQNLIILNLCESYFRLVKPLKNFESLTELVLKACRFLKEVPEISGIPNLRKIDVSYCRKLVEVHDSVGFLSKLVLLDFSECRNLRILPPSIKSASLLSIDLSGCIKLKSVPKIFEVTENNLTTPYLNRLPCAKIDPSCLHMHKKRDAVHLSCGIRMLTKLENWMDGSQHFKKCSSDDQEKASPALDVTLSIFAPRYGLKIGGADWNTLPDKYFSTWRPYHYRLTDLYLCSCNLTDEFFYQRLPWFPNLINLNVCLNKFTILPEGMNDCHHLETLILDGSKDLREVKGIPPNIKFLSVIGCIFLNSQSLRKLLSQCFHEDGGREVIIPGYRIPKGLDHHCAESSISFWFHGEFPRLALWFVSAFSKVKIRMFINGMEVLGSTDYNKPIVGYEIGCKIPCIQAYDVHEWGKKSKTVLRKDEWNHVLILDDGQDTHGMGVHVYKKEKGPDTVRFINPNPPNRTFIINHKLDLITSFSLSKNFCPLLGMRVSDAATNSQEREEFYRFMRESKYLPSPIWKAITVMEASTKVKALIWKFSIKYPRDLPTCCYLFSRRLVKCPMCLICGTEYETTEHVFFECPWTQPLWFASDFAWIMNDKWSLTYGISIWLNRKLDHIMKLHSNAESVIGLMGNICWVIWKARNEFILKDKPVNPLEALMTAKAMHMQYSSEASTSTIHSENVNGAKAKYKVKRYRKYLSKNNIGMEPTYDKGNGVEIKIKWKKGGKSNSNNKVEPICDQGNVKDKEVRNKFKQKGIFVSYNINEMVPTCDKGTHVENKAKQKREEECSNNIEVKPNFDKGLVFPIEMPSKAKGADVAMEKEEELKQLHDEVNKMFPKEEEMPLEMRKQKYNQQSQSKIARHHPFDELVIRIDGKTTTVNKKTFPNEPSSANLSKTSNKQGESMLQSLATIMQEPIEETPKFQEKKSLDKEAFVNENAPKENLITNQTNVGTEIEMSSGNHFSSKVLEEQMHVLHKLNIFHTNLNNDDFNFGDGDDDPISKLASLISMDEEVSTSQLSQARNNDKLIEEEVERESMIKKAMLTLSESFQFDLSTIYSTPEAKVKLEQAIQFLQSVTAKDDITIQCKSFIDNLAEYLPIFWEQLSKVPKVKSKHVELVQRKQDLTAFSKVALVKMQQFIEKCSSVKNARDENLEKIQALEQQIANMQVELQSRQRQHLKLECSFKQVNEERNQFNLKAKQVVDDFIGVKDLLKSVENELQETLLAEASAKLQWQELQKTFHNSLKKLVD